MPGLMVCGTNSDAGKSTVVTGLCRLLARKGVKVAPFKAQNMALNSYVTPSGHEIGRAQGIQALAARVTPEVAMNPILLKPTGELSSQVVVLGRPWAHLDAAGYHQAKPSLWRLVLESLEDLRQRFDMIILEGAGSPAEINLDYDIVNLRVARAARVPAVVVGDIDRGGVFAALFGTVALLAEEARPLVKGFVINKLRGDPALLGDGPAQLERLTGVPTLGVLPYLHDVALDAEDSLALSGPRPGPDPAGRDTPTTGDALDVAAVGFPRLSNFTDLDALALEPGVTVRLVDDPGALGNPDLVILPGTKATVGDLEWLQGQGMAAAIETLAAVGTTVLGICGGYQMLGRSITDPVESGRAAPVAGLGWLPVDTTFEPGKITRQRRGRGLGQPVSGYQIHHGRTSSADTTAVDTTAAGSWITLDDDYGVVADGAATEDRLILGTSLHGLFEEDGFRGAFLTEVAHRRGKQWHTSAVSFAAARELQIDRLADLLEAHLDLAAVEALLT